MRLRCIELRPEESEIRGYCETRRQLLIGTPAAFMACLAAPRSLLAAIQDVDVDLDAFLTETDERAVGLKGDQSRNGQDKYVEYLASHVSAVKDVSVDSLSDKTWKSLDPGVFLGVSGRNQAFFVVQWRLDPGAYLPAHCHPKTSVCTLGLEGSTKLRHFEADSNAPSYRDDRETEFVIRETRNIELRSGDVSTLTEYRDNIHLFEAGKRGARGIDITTDYGGDGSFSFVDFERSRPIDSNANTYLARWIGTNLD